MLSLAVRHSNIQTAMCNTTLQHYLTSALQEGEKCGTEMEYKAD